MEDVSIGCLNSPFTIHHSPFLMPVSAARIAAFEVLRRVDLGRSYAVELLQRREVSGLKEADRRLATELVMGVLRWRGELDFQIERLSQRSLKRLDPEVAAILRMGVYQIRFLTKVPKAAAVNEAVELCKAARKRSTAGLVNAVLRKCSPPARPLTTTPFDGLTAGERDSLRRTVPAWLLERWAGRTWPMGKPRESEPAAEMALRLAWASVQVPRVTLRITGKSANLEQLRRDLAGEGISTQLGVSAPQALVVESGSILGSKALREGRVVIQDEGSQLVAELLAPQAGQKVLDLCAAPGIKTGQLTQALGKGTLVACDVSGVRLRTLVKLLASQVPPEVGLHIVRLDATRPLPFRALFDRILLDVPCSGTGTLARNPEIKWRLQAEDIGRLGGTQTNMLERALEVLAPGGRLVYATCSLEPEENQEVVEKVLAGAGGFRVLTRAELASEFPWVKDLFDAQGYFRTRPDLHGMDGFFAAVIHREIG